MVPQAIIFPGRLARWFWLGSVFACVASRILASSSGFTPLAGDVTSYDPSQQVFPVSEESIRIAVFFPFSGPGAINGHMSWAAIGWATHDVNSQGGIWVDGKKKKIRLIRADHQGKPSTAKRVLERACLVDRVDLIIGTAGSHLSLIAQQVAAKYRTIYLNIAALSDMLMDERNFNRYTFRTCPTTSMLAKALAHFYADRPTRKFYLLCQDYLYGHAFGEAFKQTLLEEKPDAQIVGEDYHALFAKDYAPYLEKVRGFGAEVIITGDWSPDIDNLVKQSRQMGMRTPIAGPFADMPNPLRTIGGPEGAGLVVVGGFNAAHRLAREFTEAWNRQWRGWNVPPYTSSTFKWPLGFPAIGVISTYWYLDLLEESGTTDPEKVVAAFEKSDYELFGVQLKMRPSDHQALMAMAASELVFPSPWHEEAAGWGDVLVIPSSAVLPSQPIITDIPISVEKTAREESHKFMYVSQAIHGLTYGMLLFLVASGLTLIFGMMGVLNIAHASFFMLAAYFCHQILALVGSYWLALLLAPVAVALLGVLMQRFLLARVQARGLGHVGELLLTLGIALVISESVKMVWGTDSLVISIPDSLKGVVMIGAIQYPIYRLFVVGLAFAVLGLMAWLLFRTRLGTIVRAAVSDTEMVGVLGINIPLISSLVFGVGTWMAGVAGVAAAPLLTVYPGMAEQMSLDAFVVVVLGGLGSLMGAFVASLVLGELNAYGVQFIPRLAPVLMFALMAVVLASRPTGLFGERK